jgi:hypothetical protein
MGWEIMNHPYYSTDLALSDFHLFISMKVHLEGQKFQTDDELKWSGQNWLCGQNKALYAVGNSNLQVWWGKSVVMQSKNIWWVSLVILICVFCETHVCVCMRAHTCDATLYRQQLQSKQICDSHYWVTASLTSLFLTQQRNSVFCTVRAKRL